MYASKPEGGAVGLPFHFVPENVVGHGIAEGDICIASAGKHSDRRDLARLVLHGNLEELRCGSAQTKTRIVIKDDPRLDDMLAALIAELRSEGKPIPPGMAAFAKYAADAAAGKNLGSLPIEKSLAALYMFIRTGFGPLSDDQQADEFGKAWAQLAAAILAASNDTDVDPFEQDVFPSWLFRTEQEQLLKDRAVYLNDRRTGQRWWVRLKNENSKSKSNDLLPEQPALILSRPNSRIWRFWADCDPDAAGGIVARTVNRLRGRSIAPGFAFRGAIENDRKHWAFSTRASQDIKIRSLQPRLQEVEQARSPTAKQDPWVVVERYAGTMVSGPWSGSVIPDDEILGIVGQWANARPMRFRMSWSAAGMIGTAFAAVVGVVLGVILLRASQAGASENAPPDVETLVERSLITPNVVKRPRGPADGNPHARQKMNETGPVVVTCRLMLDEHPKPPWPSGKATVTWRINDGQKNSTEVALANNNEPITVSFPAYFYRSAGNNEVEIWVSFDLDGRIARTMAIAEPILTAAPDLSFKPKLFILPIAVIDYADMDRIESARSDAEKTIAALTRDEIRSRYKEVKVLLDEKGSDRRLILNPTKDQITDGLDWLQKNTDWGDVVLIQVSAHGRKVGDDFYIIPNSCLTRTDAAVKKNGIWCGSLIHELSKLRSQVVVVIDTCYSGEGDWVQAIKPKFDQLAQPRMLILTASKTEAEVMGNRSHGVLTYAFLRAIGAATAGASEADTLGAYKAPVSFQDLIVSVPEHYKKNVQNKDRQVGISHRNQPGELEKLFLIPN